MENLKKIENVIQQVQANVNAEKYMFNSIYGVLLKSSVTEMDTYNVSSLVMFSNNLMKPKVADLCS